MGVWGHSPQKIFEKSALKVHIFVRWDACRSFVLLELQRLAHDTSWKAVICLEFRGWKISFNPWRGDIHPCPPPSGYAPDGRYACIRYKDHTNCFIRLYKNTAIQTSIITNDPIEIYHRDTQVLRWHTCQSRLLDWHYRNCCSSLPIMAIYSVSKKPCQLIFCSLSVKYEPISIKIGKIVPE